MKKISFVWTTFRHTFSHFTSHRYLPAGLSTPSFKRSTISVWAPVRNCGGRFAVAAPIHQSTASTKCPKVHRMRHDGDDDTGRPKFGLFRASSSLSDTIIRMYAYPYTKWRLFLTHLDLLLLLKVNLFCSSDDAVFARVHWVTPVMNG